MSKSGVFKRTKGWFRSRSRGEGSSGPSLPTPQENDLSISWQGSGLVAPWVDWEVDNEFLGKLKLWNQSHPESTTSAIMKKVQDKINALGSLATSDVFDNALKLIPDSPFPAGSLVRCLVNVLLAGMLISEAKNEAFQFTMEVVEDINRMAEAFGTATAPERLLVQSWNDLKTMRDLTNGICKWAYEMTRKTAPLHGNIEKTIREFKEKNDRARSGFIVRMLIELMGCLRIKAPFAGFRDHPYSSWSRQLERQAGRAFGGAINERMDFIKTTLQNHIATMATFDQQGKDDCHEQTRDRWLSNIDRWVSSPSDTERCWWITGQPGVGKSAIALTVAECLEASRPISASSVSPDDSGSVKVARATLHGQYFISDTLPETTDEDRVFPTIAMQLALASPVAAVIIHDALKSNRTIGNKLSRNQAISLFVKPMCAIALQEPGTIVTLFDGVDELSKTDGTVLSTFSSILVSIFSDLPPNVRILAFSRPETFIISRITNAPFVARFDLLTEESKEDVRRFLTAELQKIADLYELPGWPSAHQIELLNENAAGHLGWAALAIRWIGREVEKKGDTKYIREKVFDDVKEVRKGNLYDLYSFILRRVIPDDMGEQEFHGCQSVLGFLAVMHRPQSIHTIDNLLGLKDAFSVLHFFKRISSIVTSGLNPISGSTVPLPHKSFIDYISTANIDGRMHIELKKFHYRLAIICLKLLQSSLHFNMGNMRTSDDSIFRRMYCTHRRTATNEDSPPVFKYEGDGEDKNDPHRKPFSRFTNNLLSADMIYACRSFYVHVQNVPILDSALIGSCRHFIENLLLFWLETMCLFDSISESISILGILSDHFKSSQDKQGNELGLLFAQAIDIAAIADSSSHLSSPHVYLSGLALSDPSCHLVSLYQRSYHRLIHMKTPVCPLTPPVLRAAVSGTHIAAVIDSSLQVFDIGNRETVVPIFSTPVRCLSFPDPGHTITISHDLSMVAVGQQECYIWNFVDGSLIAQLDVGCPISAIALSPKGIPPAMVIGSVNGSVYFCDMKQSMVMLRALQHPGPTEPIIAVQYSKDASKFMTASSNATVRIWDLQGNTISVSKIAESGERSIFTSMVFSPYLEWTAACHTPSFSTVILRNLSTEEQKSFDNIHVFAWISASRWSPRDMVFAEYTFPFAKQDAVAISTDGRLLAIKGIGPYILIRDVSSSRLLASLVGHSALVTSIAFIGDGHCLMSASLDGTIRIWDLASLLQGVKYDMDVWGLGTARTMDNTGAWKSASYDRGIWVMGKDGECLFWCPRSRPFRNPRNKIVIGHCYDLDFTHFVHGEDWIRCQEPILDEELK